MRSAREQIDFATERLDLGLVDAADALVLLEYSDNYEWVAEHVRPVIASRYPSAKLFMQPLSLTSGAHLGPGTWGIAYVPL